MSNKTIALLLALWPTVGFSTGGMVSGGGDLELTEHNPWFLGESPVSYCFSAGTDTSVGVADVRAVTQQAIANWERTITALKPYPTPFAFADGKVKNLATTFVETDCNRGPDLVIHFGDGLQEASRELAGHERTTLAFAYQTSFNRLQGRGKGFIWLGPDRGPLRFAAAFQSDFWGNQALLYNVLAHELGHVFGFPHIDNTIMDRRLPTGLAAYGSISEKLSTDDLLAINWATRGGVRRTCGVMGPLSGREAEVVRLIAPRADVTARLRVCASVAEPDQEELDTWRDVEAIDLEISDVSGPVQTRRIVVDPPSRITGALESPVRRQTIPIGGNYFRNEFYFLRRFDHEFLAITQSLEIQGSMSVDGRGSIPVLASFNVEGPRAMRLILVIGGRFATLGFRSEDNWNALLTGARFLRPITNARD